MNKYFLNSCSFPEFSEIPTIKTGKIYSEKALDKLFTEYVKEYYFYDILFRLDNNKFMFRLYQDRS